MNVRIEESFELLSQQEWDDFLAVNYFDNMIIEDKKDYTSRCRSDGYVYSDV